MKKDTLNTLASFSVLTMILIVMTSCESIEHAVEGTAPYKMVKKVVHYSPGKQSNEHGLKYEFHSNGKKKSAISWNHGWKEGKEENWYYSGIQQNRIYWKKGQITEIYREWDDTAKLIAKVNYKDGEIIEDLLPDGISVTYEERSRINAEKQRAAKQRRDSEQREMHDKVKAAQEQERLPEVREQQLKTDIPEDYLPRRGTKYDPNDVKKWLDQERSK